MQHRQGSPDPQQQLQQLQHQLPAQVIDIKQLVCISSATWRQQEADKQAACPPQCTVSDQQGAVWLHTQVGVECNSSCTQNSNSLPTRKSEAENPAGSNEMQPAYMGSLVMV